MTWPISSLLVLGSGACGSEPTPPSDVAPAPAEQTAVAPTETKPTETKPTETKPTETKPTGTTPTPEVPKIQPTPETDNASDPTKPPTYTIADLERVEPNVLPEPPWAYTAFASVAITQGTPPALRQLSKIRNAIIDDEVWWRSHGVVLPQFVLLPVASPRRPTHVALPPEVPRVYRRHTLDAGYDDPDHDIFTYGDNRIVVVVDAKQTVLASFDFAKWTPPGTTSPDHHVSWATTSDGVLFVAVGYNGYASDSGGKTGYISAVDLASGALLWRSEPLVSFALTNFLLRDGWIISGYGFTAEDDYLFLIDATNGSVAKKIKLKSGPDNMVVKDDRLYVRTYDTNYEFSL